MTQQVSLALAFSLKRGTSLLNLLFGGERFFLDTMHMSLHDGGEGLSLFVETNALHLTFHAGVGANVRWKRSRISSRVFSLKIRLPTTALF